MCDKSLISYDVGVIFHYKINAQPRICVRISGISSTVQRKDDPLTFVKMETVKGMNLQHQNSLATLVLSDEKKTR